MAAFVVAAFCSAGFFLTNSPFLCLAVAFTVFSIVLVFYWAVKSDRRYDRFWCESGLQEKSDEYWHTCAIARAKFEIEYANAVREWHKKNG